jgi:Na+:H+ antiporter
VLTAPQAAATLAATLIGFEIGLFGTSVVNAVLVLILVSILVAALITQRVITWVPADIGRRPPLGSKVLVVTGAAGPSDAAVRAATLLARADGGHSDVLITRAQGEAPPDLRALEKRIFRHGFDGHLRTGVSTVGDAVTQAMLADSPSLVLVDDAGFDASPASLPVLVLDGVRTGPDAFRLILAGDERSGVADEIARRLARGEPKARFRRSPDRPGVPAS